MGIFKALFRGDSKDERGQTTRVRESNENQAKQVGDHYTHVDGGKHVHESYTLDKASGAYREYAGGENSGDRSHNKQ